MFDEDPKDAYENYPCWECKGEIRCFEGVWACVNCKKIYNCLGDEDDNPQTQSEDR